MRVGHRRSFHVAQRDGKRKENGKKVSRVNAEQTHSTVYYLKKLIHV